MVIQRWQSVWLLVATILIAVFCFVPMAIVPDAAAAENGMSMLMPSDMPVFLTVNLLAAVLLFMSIFLYKNTKRQKTLTLVSMLLIVVMIVTETLVLFNWNTEAGAVEWLGSIFLLLGALVFAALAYRGISKDQKLLRAADRLR